MWNNEIDTISIKDYLEEQGFEFKRLHNGRYVGSSPFSNDSNPSFYIYPNNTFYCFSTGKGGGIIQLVQALDNCDYRAAFNIIKNKIQKGNYKPYEKPIYTPNEKSKKDFDYKKYINYDKEECEKIRKYAESRGIKEGYWPAVYFTKNPTKDIWERNPSLMLVHVDKDLKPCGAKFRKITNENPRFSARGTLGMFVTDIQDAQKNVLPVLYVVEGEINALSLRSYLKERLLRANVISLGGIGARIQREVDLVNLVTKDTLIKLIIDYDGNEELYQERLKMYKDLNAKPVKMILPKGEDINSLYAKNKMYLIEHLILN